MTWTGWEGGVPPPPPPAAPHPPPHVRPSVMSPGGGGGMYGDFPKFAINGNVCMCEDFLGGTNRGKKVRKQHLQAFLIVNSYQMDAWFSLFLFFFTITSRLRKFVTVRAEVVYSDDPAS